MNNTTQEFYDRLASDYHLVYRDWEASIKRQAKIIDTFLREHSGQSIHTVLDCTCGIGTQVLGLAELGYQAQGTDLSPAAMERAKQEAKKRGYAIPFQVVDIRELAKKVKGTFDAVISFDNSLPHLTDPAELFTAAENIREKMSQGGIFMGSIRDYDAIRKEKPVSTMPVTRAKDGEKSITFQLWEWEEDHCYAVQHFTVKGQGQGFETHMREMKYRAYTRAEIDQIFQQAGFRKVEWFMPGSTGFFQPIFKGLI